VVTGTRELFPDSALTSIFGWVLIELLFTRSRAEVILLSVAQAGILCIALRNIHPANRIYCQLNHALQRAYPEYLRVSFDHKFRHVISYLSHVAPSVSFHFFMKKRVMDNPFLKRSKRECSFGFALIYSRGTGNLRSLT